MTFPDLVPGLRERLPQLRGRLTANQPLAEFTWFRVGGPAQVLFSPEDESDLAYFLARCPRELPVTAIGVGSNVIVRDGGVPGVVIRLGRGFNHIREEANHHLRVGAAALDQRVAKAAQEAGIAGLSFLRGIPGSIGGALRMNAGAYGREIKDVLAETRGIDRRGIAHLFATDEMGLSYRHCDVPDDVIFTEAVFRGEPGDPAIIAAEMERITQSRDTTQPVKSRTGGSTFKNPPGQKAWRLIEAAGCRGSTLGGAQVSELHCNFLINLGHAGAADIEELGETVRARVKAACGVELDWEIKRIGVKGKSKQ